MKAISVLAVVSLLVLCLFPGGLAAEASSAGEDVFKTPRGIVTDLYKAVTFGPGKSPDWERVKTFLIEEAVIVLRTARDKSTVMSREGFVELFISDIKKYGMDKTGFQENVVSCRVREFGDIAWAVVVYEASVPGDPRPPQRGLDSFQLMKKDGRWWIVSIINEVPRPGIPIPKEYLPKKLMK